MSKLDEKEESKEASKQTIILVTGANKGIGLEAVKLLAKENENYKVLLGCRNFNFVPKLDTTGKLRKDPAKWELAGKAQDNKATRIELLKKSFEGIKNVDFVEIDVTNADSISKAVAYVEKTYKRLDILVNNAGIAWPDNNAFDTEVVKGTFKVNYHGVINVTDAFLKLIPSKTGKIITVASTAGMLKSRIKDENMRKKLLSDKLTLKELNEIREKFEAAVAEFVKSKDADKFGKQFSQSAYGTSKCFIIGWSRILAKTLQDKGITVVHYCPGWCKTYMTNGNGKRTATDGAQGIKLLCGDTKGKIKSGDFCETAFNKDDKGAAVPVLQVVDWNK